MSEHAKERELRARIVRWVEDIEESDATADERIRIIEDRIRIETEEIPLEILKLALAHEYEAKGDEPAGDALYREVLPEIEYWYRKLIRANRTDYGKNVGAIKDRIHSKPDAPEVDELYGYLAHNHSLTGDDAAAEAIYLQLAERHPDNPLHLNSAAFTKGAVQGQHEAAMELINRALEVAHRTGELRRYTLGNKARIALDLKRYDIVESVLKEIMQLKMDFDIPDIGRERDFFDRLPPDSIDPDVARQYEQYCLAVGLKAHKR
jgi:tetratricopeptide (TPR) repeat protein